MSSLLLSDFDCRKPPNRWIRCGCGDTFKASGVEYHITRPSSSPLLTPLLTYTRQEKDRAAHIETEAHVKWVDTASAFDLAAFVPLPPQQPPPALTPRPPPPALDKTERTPLATPGPTPATALLLASSPPPRLWVTPPAAAGSPVVPRREQFEDEKGNE